MKICIHSSGLRVFLALAFLVLAPGALSAEDREFEIWVQRWGVLDGEQFYDFDVGAGHLLNHFHSMVKTKSRRSTLSQSARFVAIENLTLMNLPLDRSRSLTADTAEQYRKGFSINREVPE